MKRRPSGSITLSAAAGGFANHEIAEGFVQRSVNSYERLLIATDTVLKQVELIADELTHGK